MSPAFRVFLAALVAAALCTAQTNDCENKCQPKLAAALKCTTIDCSCYAYDDADYVSCLRSQCGRGFDSVRAGQVLGCSYMGVTLTPDPPNGATGSNTETPTPSAAASNPKSTSGTSSPGGGSSGDSSNTGGSGTSSSNSGSQASGGNRLSTAELIGIVIGAVSAVATIIGVWVTIRQKKNKKNRGNSNATVLPVVYQPIPPPIPSYPSVQNIHVSPVYNHGPATNYHHPPPAYQPTYHAVDMNWRK